MPDDAIVSTQPLIPAGPTFKPEPPKPPEITAIGRGRGRKGVKHKRHAKAGDDPLDRVIARRRAQAILVLKIEGRKPREIAAELGIPVKSVYWALYQLRRGGHIEAKREIADAINLRIKPLIVERLEERLEQADVSESLLIESAKGTGVFVAHQKLNTNAAPIQQALVIKFEMPEGPAPTTAVGEIHGQSFIDAELVK